MSSQQLPTAEYDVWLFRKEQMLKMKESQNFGFFVESEVWKGDI